MAGIEKIDEFDGEYIGHEMYNHARNHIQIQPKHRKKFRGAKHVLHIFIPKKRFVHKFRGIGICYSSFFTEEMAWYEPPFTSLKEFIRHKRIVEKERLENEWEFALQVFDSTLQGQVEGIYMRWSSDLSALKRRMKRMLRKDLIIEYHNCSYHEWTQSHVNKD